MKTINTKAENWIDDLIEIKIVDANNFEVQDYKFLIGEPRITEDEDMKFEFTPVFSLSHSKEEPLYTVSRDLNPSKYSDSLCHASDGDIEREANSVPEVIAKLVAMCF